MLGVADLVGGGVRVGGLGAGLARGTEVVRVGGVNPMGVDGGIAVVGANTAGRRVASASLRRRAICYFQEREQANTKRNHYIPRRGGGQQHRRW